MCWIKPQAHKRRAQGPQPKPGRIRTLCLPLINRPLNTLQIAVREQPMPGPSIKLDIGAVRSGKDSDDGSTAPLGKITVFADGANAVTHVKALREHQCC